MSQRRPDILSVFLEPGGSVPFPDAWNEAAVRFEEARIDYEYHRFTRAAERFLEAARLLQEVSGFHASSAAANRLGSYENAWSAFSAVGKRAEGRAALESSRAGRSHPRRQDPQHH